MAGFVGIFGEAVGDMFDDVSRAADLTIYSPKSAKRKLYQSSNLNLVESYFPLLEAGENYANEGNIHVWFTGEVYHINDPGALPGERFCDRLLANYKTGRLDSFLSRVNGIYNAIIFDGDSAELLLVTDRYGLKPLYLYRLHNALIFAPELKCFPCFKKFDLSIRKDVVDCFIDLQHFMGNETWFNNVEVAAPSTIYSFNLKRSTFSSRRYWSWKQIESSPMSFDDAASEMSGLLDLVNNELFNSASRVGVALSGGLDSRAILAAVHKRDPVTYTFGTDDSYDVEIARRVTSMAGVKHVHFNTYAADWLIERFSGVWKTDGMLNMLHMHYSHLMPAIAEIMDINLSGFLGDAVLGGSYLERKGVVVTDKRITEEIARRYYGKHFERCDLNDSYFDIEKIDPYLFYNRGRRMIGMGAEEPYKTTPQRLPFMDIRLMDLSYSLPDKFRMKSRVYNAALLRKYPRFYSRIPHATTGVPISENPSLVNRGLKAINRAKWVVKYKLGMQTSYADVQNWIRDPDIAIYISTLLDRKTALYSEFTHVDFRTAYLEPHLKRRGNFVREVMGAITFEVWLQQILKGNLIKKEA